MWYPRDMALTPTQGALLGALAGLGYYATVEMDRRPEDEDKAYLMPDTTDYLALMGGAALVWEGQRVRSPFAALSGAAIFTIHGAKMRKKRQIRRKRHLTSGD